MVGIKKSLFFLFLLLFSGISLAGEFKLRAREHFESYKLNSRFAQNSYKGLAPTINAWWEKPYATSYGLAFSPGLGKFDQSSASSDSIQEFRIYRIGGELKHFPKIALDYLYVRGGVGLSLLDSKPLGNFFGIHSYAGLGYEIPLKSLGIALELATRYELFEKGLHTISITPSIGFHFYNMF